MTDSFEAVFEATRSKLFAYLLRLTRNGETAGELLQESATRCLQHYGDRAISPALLFTVARNAFTDHLRRTGRLTDLEENVPDEQADPERVAMVSERLGMVLKGFQHLSRDERDILAMVVSSELSYEQIARIQETSVSNIKVKVHRARLKLRRYLEVESHA